MHVILFHQHIFSIVICTKKYNYVKQNRVIHHKTCRYLFHRFNTYAKVPFVLLAVPGQKASILCHKPHLAEGSAASSPNPLLDSPSLHGWGLTPPLIRDPSLPSDSIFTHSPDTSIANPLR